MKYKNGVYDEVYMWRDGKRVKLCISPEIEQAIAIADNLSRSICGREITITAIFDGTHRKGSKHYEGNAFDLRTWHYKPEQLTEFISLLKIKLGPSFDIVLHSTHLHVEYDPKNN